MLGNTKTLVPCKKELGKMTQGPVALWEDRLEAWGSKQCSERVCSKDKEPKFKIHLLYFSWKLTSKMNTKPWICALTLWLIFHTYFYIVPGEERRNSCLINSYFGNDCFVLCISYVTLTSCHFCWLLFAMHT